MGSECNREAKSSDLLMANLVGFGKRNVMGDTECNYYDQVYYVYYLCTACTMCVYLLYYVCIASFTLGVGLLTRSQYSEGPATGHLDTGFSWFPCV